MDIIKALAEELNIGRHQAEAAVKLIDEGNTIPFIARYRKDSLHPDRLSAPANATRHRRNQSAKAYGPNQKQRASLRHQ